MRTAPATLLLATLVSACQSPGTVAEPPASATTAVPSADSADPELARALQGLKATDPKQRTNAALALGSLGVRAKGALAALAASLSDPEVEVAIAAAGALGQLSYAGVKLGGAVEALQLASGTAAAGVRIAALEALALADETATLAPAQAKAFYQRIGTALNDTDATLRAAAADIAGRVSSAAGDRLDEATRGPWRTQLHGLLSDPLPVIRAASARGLGRIGDLALSHQTRLRELATDPDVLVRLWARQTLGTIDMGDPLSLAWLVHALRSGGPNGLLVQGLTGKFGGTVEDVLLAILGGDRATWSAIASTVVAEALPGIDQEVLWLVVRGLQISGKDLSPLIPQLLALLERTVPAVSLELIAALRSYAGTVPPVAQAFTRSVRDLSPEVATAAAAALVDLARVDPKTRKVLVEALASVNDAARAGLTDAIGRIAQGSAALQAELMPVLNRLSTHAAPAVRAAAFKQLASMLDSADPIADLNTTIRRALETGGTVVQAATLEGLSTLSSPSKLSAFSANIRALLGDNDGLVRIAAAKALGRLGTLGAEAGEAITDLAARLTDELPEVRVAALKALGAFGDRAAAALPAILSALASGADGVREAAIVALASLGDAAKAAIPALRALAIGDSSLARLARDTLDKLDR